MTDATDAVDVIIPTCKSREQIAQQMVDARETAGVPVRIIPTCLAGSAAQNRNAGLDQATSPVVLMMDDDITGFPQGWAVRMLNVMRDHPHCQMASPRLLKPDGSFALMTGMPNPELAGLDHCEVIPLREVCTACIAIRLIDLRFDERFQGSGFEDNDYCRELICRFPDAEFICIHDLNVVHINEKKNQGGAFWKCNQKQFNLKWENRWEGRKPKCQVT